MNRKTYLVCIKDRWYAEKHLTEWNDGKREIKRKFVSLKIQGKKNRAKAMRELRNIEGKGNLTKFIANKTPSLIDFATNYLEQTKMNVRKKTFSSYIYWLRMFTDRYYNYSLDEITYQEIELFKKELFKKYKPATTNTALRAVRTMFQDAVTKNIIEKNPLASTKYADTPERILKEYWNKEQFEKFISTIKNKRLRMAYSLSFYAGLRVNEVVNIKWEDLNVRTILVRTREQFRTKNDHSRTVPLFTSLKNELDETNRKNEYIVPCRGDYISKSFLMYRKRYNEMHSEKLPEITFHGLRHSFATMLVKKISLPELQQILGHSKIETTMIYIHIKSENIFFEGIDL